MLAMVEGEAQAARATVDFIREVGFVDDGGGEDRFGDLRMVTFRYQAEDADGQDLQRELSVPLLSIVPIPALQVKRASFDFSVNINDLEADDTSTSTSLTRKYGAPLRLRTSVAERSAATEAEDAARYQMKVQVEVGQADIPAGLSRLFDLMESSIRSTNG